MTPTPTTAGDLRGSTVVITGVGRRGQVGEVVSAAFAGSGAHLILVDRDKAAVKWLENAARVFDEYAEERHTAYDFIAWLKPDLLGGGRPDHRDYDGAFRKQGEAQGDWPPQTGRMVTRG